MKVAAGEGTRARDILDIDRRMRREDEADDDVLIAHVAASGEVCRPLPTVLALELEAHERLVVDGAWLLPSFVAERAAFVLSVGSFMVEGGQIPQNLTLVAAEARWPACRENQWQILRGTCSKSIQGWLPVTPEGGKPSTQIEGQGLIWQSCALAS
jgi:hypothetical protein